MKLLRAAAVIFGMMLGVGACMAQGLMYVGPSAPTSGCFGAGLGLNTATGDVYSCPYPGLNTWTLLPGTAGQTKINSAVAAATMTFANKTFSTAASGNSFSYGGIAVTNTITDGYFTVPPGACAFGSSGGTVVTNGLAVSGHIPVLEIATTTATETATVVCAITLPTKLTSGHGVTVNNVVLRYGPSVGTIGTCNAPTLGTQLAPTPALSESPASATLTTAGGSLTVLPVVGSCNAAAVTAGQIYSEKITLGTPVAFNTDLTVLYFTQSFVGPDTASFTLDIAGIDVHYTNMPL